MPVYKDTNSTWFTEFRYKDWSGNNCRHKKKDFKTQREVKVYERDFLSSGKTGIEPYE